ncbi:hypothetical protein [Sphingomonas japonica]|uniref:Uncharacterized protein n=1 Tax=Sphingomonas japonica TaxID=511662 RepID=A0ABX0U2M1_9SPHN|nr:hypothetical protein [Sphingomonas japonica]NIJ24826.1 hypothetical protein [Sphingomonas japonica]
MRKMIDRIAAYFGFVRATAREYSRINNGADSVARGQRWEVFYAEDGGIRDMIAGLRRGYFEKVGGLKPGDTESLIALGMADRIAREIDREVQTIIETGKLRQFDEQHANKIAAIRR